MGRGADKTVRKRRDDKQVHTEPGDNTKYLMHSLRLAALPKIHMTDEDAVQQRVMEYFQICAEEDMKPSSCGLCLALDIDERYLWDIKAGRKLAKTRAGEILKRAQAILELQLNDYMQNGKINPVSGIFLLKNHFGYQDRVEFAVEPKAPLGEGATEDELRAKYLESVPEISRLPESVTKRAEMADLTEDDTDYPDDAETD